MRLRHANPWSFWTRCLAALLFVFAIRSRALLGRFALASVALAIAWRWFADRMAWIFRDMAAEHPEYRTLDTGETETL